MKCEEFHERLNDCLDAGLQPSRDRKLRQHCLGCQECRSDLEAWQWIAQSVAPKKTRKPSHLWRVALPIGLAAGLCFMLLRVWPPTDDAGVVANRRSAPEITPTEEMAELSALPPQWNDPDWIDQWADRVAEPLVPLSRGLAPLGRSFQTAFTLLVLPREGSEPEAQPNGQPLQSKVLSRSLDVSYA